MNRRPPSYKWAIAAGCALAFLAAAVNACYLISLGTSVSHLTGDVSRVAVTLSERGPEAARLLGYLVAAAGAFVAGAGVAGFFIHHPDVEFSRPYGRSVMFIGLCLEAAHWTFYPLPGLSVALAGFACGYQNALATHFRGMVLRTTHVTGLLTDIGTALGMRARGHRIARWRILVPSLLVASFFAGAVGGALLCTRTKAPLRFLSITYFTLGAVWSIWKHCFRTDRR